MNPGHFQWSHRSHVAQLDQEGNVWVGVMPSSAFHWGSFLSTHTALQNSPQWDTVLQKRSHLGRTWIRLRTLISAHQSASFARQKVRLFEEPWTQRPVDGLLLCHHDVSLSFSINVVGYDAVVICHPIFSLYIFAVQSSNVHGIEDGFSRFYPNGRHLSCTRHLQQGFMALSAPLLQRDSMAMPAPLRRLESRWK